MFADEYVNVAPTVMIGRRQDIFMPESVQVTPLEIRLMRIEVRSERPIAIAQRADPQTHQQTDGKSHRLNQYRMANLHRSTDLLAQRFASFCEASDPYSDGHSPVNTSTAGPVMYT